MYLFDIHITKVKMKHTSLTNNVKKDSMELRDVFYLTKKVSLVRRS